MFRKIITVSLNPSLDVAVQVDHFGFDEPCFATQETIYPGGKGINVSRVLSSLGLKNQAFCIAGEENLSMLKKRLESSGVDAQYLPVPDCAVRENFSVMLENGKVLQISRSGPQIDESVIARFEQLLLEQVDSETLVVFAGSMPPGVSALRYRQMIQKVRKVGAPTAVDTNVMKPEDYQVMTPFVVKPNRLELEKIFQCTIRSEAQLKKYSLQLAQWCNHVLVSLGEDGLFYAGNGRCMKIQVPKVEVRSTIGAGDTTLSGFLYGLHCGWNLEKALCFGAAAGTASVSCLGTGVPERAQIDKVLQQVTISSDRKADD